MPPATTGPAAATGPNSVARDVSVTVKATPFWLAITLAQPNLFSRTFTKLSASQDRRKVPIVIVR